MPLRRTREPLNRYLRILLVWYRSGSAWPRWEARWSPARRSPRSGRCRGLRGASPPRICPSGSRARGGRRARPPGGDPQRDARPGSRPPSRRCGASPPMPRTSSARPSTALRGELEVGAPRRPLAGRVPATSSSRPRECRAARPAGRGSARCSPGRRPAALVRSGPVDLEALVLGSAGRRACGSPRARGVTVRLGAVAPAAVQGDAVALERALLNLVDNAVRYTPAGGKVEISAVRDGRLGGDLGAGQRPGHRAGRRGARVRAVRPAGRRAGQASRRASGSGWRSPGRS